MYLEPLTLKHIILNDISLQTNTQTRTQEAQILSYFIMMLPETLPMCTIYTSIFPTKPTPTYPHARAHVLHAYIVDTIIIIKIK